jgi:hypothetical protein
VGKALFFSLAAVMRNKWPFLQFSIAWGVVALVSSLLVQVLRAALGASPMALSIVLSPLSLIILTALYASFWPSYRDVVSDDAPPVPSPPL